ncbi:MAG: CBS domain-containing protein [Candidatus Thermoplasmatota archaeon]|nr:CBS domain-containing protein [Candidatus Thermoplasmatota archaeon]
MTRQSVQEIKAKDIMARNLITVEPHEDVSSAISKMQQHDINEVPVITEDGKILGLVNYETLLKRRSIPMSTKVENVMAFPPRVNEEMPVIEIAETMLSSGYRAVPVTEKEYIVGIVSRTDLVGIIPELNILKEIEVSEIMTESPHFINEKDTLEQARSIMYRLDVRAMPVIDSKGELTGVLGLKDLAKGTGGKGRKRKTNDFTAGKGNVEMGVQVKSVMKTPAITIGKEAKISEAVKLMQKNTISTIIVIEGNTPIGIVTQYDLIELIASFKSEEQVFVQISGLHEAEPEAYDMMYDLIQKYIKRMAKMVTPKVFSIHVTRYDAGNAHNTGNITVRGRLTTEHELYYSTTNEWDLALALSALLSHMEKSIRKDIEKKKTASKKK